MDPVTVDRAPVPPKYASTCMDFAAGREHSSPEAESRPEAESSPEAGSGAETEIDLDFIETGVAKWAPGMDAMSVERRLGMAVLRLRLYRGWSQAMLERVSGVDQTLISRFEGGKVPGLTMRRLYAIFRALRAEEITFGPGAPTVPQSSWEDDLYGDRWEHAGRVAQARVSRRRSA